MPFLNTPFETEDFLVPALSLVDTAIALPSLLMSRFLLHILDTAYRLCQVAGAKGVRSCRDCDSSLPSALLHYELSANLCQRRNRICRILEALPRWGLGESSRLERPAKPDKAVRAGFLQNRSQVDSGLAEETRL